MLCPAMNKGLSAVLSPETGGTWPACLLPLQMTDCEEKSWLLTKVLTFSFHCKGYKKFFKVLETSQPFSQQSCIIGPLLQTSEK